MKKILSSLVSFALLPAAFAGLAGCAGPEPDKDKDKDDDNDVTAVCTEPAASVECRDQTLVALEMAPSDVSPGLIENTEVDGHFESTIDATAGGFGGDGGYVYGKFTANGLEKVEITDDESFDSMAWDVSFRRFVIRLNSGVGGPSCVTAARTAPDTDFATLAEVPENLDFNEEQFMSPGTCDVISDGSGLPGAPGVVLQNYWTYASCLQMTGNVYVVELADGHHVKLMVNSYYQDPARQQECNETGTNDSVGSAHINMSWAFLD